MSSLQLAGGSIAVITPFDRAFVNALKTDIPYAARRWDQAGKRWLVDPAYADQVADLIHSFFGETVAIPAITTSATPTTVIRQVMYIGRCKERDSGIYTATGFADGGWSISFPEQILRAYFNDELATPEQPQAPSSLYAVLGLKAFSDAESIKAAYKRLAKVWHPDVSKEPDATKRFQDINHAWSILKDDKQRRKYDCGLTLELRNQPQSKPPVVYHGDYRAPLTCGLLMLEGIERLGVLQVSKILHWADITNEHGQTMVSSWPMDGDTFETRWI
jgi:hypothetical protein